MSYRPRPSLERLAIDFEPPAPAPAPDLGHRADLVEQIAGCLSSGDSAAIGGLPDGELDSLAFRVSCLLLESVAYSRLEDGRILFRVKMR